jgi:hypothetical protein
LNVKVQSFSVTSKKLTAAPRTGEVVDIKGDILDKLAWNNVAGRAAGIGS